MNFIRISKISKFYSKITNNFLVNRKHQMFFTRLLNVNKNIHLKMIVNNDNIETRQLLCLTESHMKINHRFLCHSNVDSNEYERLAESTLESLIDSLESLLEDTDILNDISLNSGVLNLNLGKHGIYVINKQSPNRQIWLSSPLSGPKRYDYIDGDWVYKRDGITLHNLLSNELSSILKKKIVISSNSAL